MIDTKGGSDLSYNHLSVEKKWQTIWENQQTFKAQIDLSKPKFYALDMFPYPSGSGLHVGHIASYTPSDIVSRYKRTLGFNVLHPMGWDAFGLPAEQFAIQTGTHPAITTEKAINSYRKTLKSFGFSFDWSREISTCDSNYYKWTQFIFLKLWEAGLAYQKEAPVNWCPALKTVLANEEVVDGKSERGGHPVIRQPMKQWMLKITDYSEKLLQGLEQIDWPERTKEGQKNWIGKSEGARVQFKVNSPNSSNSNSPSTSPLLEFEVFTTRPDTLFGVTFMVLAPEHPLVEKITTPEQKLKVSNYQKASASKSEIDRKTAAEKTGEFTGAYAQHPLTQKNIPIWIADYVLMDYGTGAIMAVPGHDERDFEFANKFNLPVERVLEKASPDEEDTLPYTGEGKLVNSDFLNGLFKKEAITKMIQHLESKSLGKLEVQFKLRDWLFSRQRYWGEPFPMVNFPKSGVQGVPLSELPIALPEVADYEPSDQGEAPLAKNIAWKKYQKKGEEGQRETDTMPGSAGSSWYFLRYTDPTNSEKAFDFEAQKYWMPVDLYVGGPEHTVGHLLYSRFWQSFLFDQGLVSHREPFKKLAHQGLVLGSDGEKMSKSRGNTVPADQIAQSHGADALRVFICFMGPLTKDKPWSDTGIDGVKRFLDRIWRLAVNDDNQLIATQDALAPALEKLLHKTIQKVTADIETMNFNTAISAMMIFVNELYKSETRSQKALLPLIQLLMPFAPHLSEELWERFGQKGLCSLASWPQFNPALATDNVVTMAVQVNGKTRGTIEIALDATEEEAVGLALKVSTVTQSLGDKKPSKVIYKPGKILNLLGAK